MLYQLYQSYIIMQTILKIVLVKQFRPPTEQVVIELPAGLIDPNESIESTAIKNY